MPVNILFPPKCVFCRKLLSKNETDLCHECREHTPEATHSKMRIPFVAQWTAMWYYKDNVRKSIHRFKFGNARGYADVYARHLAIKLTECGFTESFDVLTWIPTSPWRRFLRGYDQAYLLAVALGKELGCKPVSLLSRTRHTRTQSSLRDAAARRANIHGVYKPRNPDQFAGKRVLLVDDVITTGATSSECARVLLTAGAKEVLFAAVATANHHNKQNR